MSRFFYWITALIGLGILISACTNRQAADDPFLITLENVSEIVPQPQRDLYGFQANTTHFEEFTVRRNESLYLILRRFDVSPQFIHEIQQHARGVVSLNRILPGQTYRIYFDTDDKPIAFVWRQSGLQYATISLTEPSDISLSELPLERRTVEHAGLIRSSLYETVRDQGASPMLVNELAAMFAWEIDFFSLRQGDHFKVIYEELYAAGEFVGVGDIKAAEFQHRGRPIRGFYYENDFRRGYFDEEGNSLEKDLLKAPFRYSQRISSSFSRNRFHPILRENRPHHGTDYAAPTGTPILAVGDGVVTEAQRRGGNGNIVQIRHNNSYRTAYLHLNGFGPGIRKGATVKQGQIIGYVGSTGLATGPHLCYRLYVNDQPVNSVTADLPASESLESEFIDSFQTLVLRYSDWLDELPLGEQVTMR
ncbi:MAG: peptidoglycan DD-metalloendopeptidase family protein [Balneolaceae bacterium]